MKLKLLFLCASLLFPSIAPAAPGGASASPHKVVIQADIVYAKPGERELKIDLHMPQGVERPPLILFIHGGGWKNGDRKRCKLAWIARHGYAIASIDYRLSPEAIFPAQIQDCKGALRWLRAHQQEHGCDASRVVAAGTSAGGHLAALMATSGDVNELEGDTGGHLDQSSRVQGALDYYGPTDFILRSHHQPAKTDDSKGSVYKLIGGPVKENPAIARLASPTVHISADDPPILILHGQKDKTVHLRQSEHLKWLYDMNRLGAKIHIEQDKGHGWSKPSETEQNIVLEFLADCFAKAR